MTVDPRTPVLVGGAQLTLRDGAPDRGEELVAYDKLGVGRGDLVGLSEGGEAANPFGKTLTPVDAYCACLIDQLSF